jgi:hypothetical protein
MMSAHGSDKTTPAVLTEFAMSASQAICAQLKNQFALVELAGLAILT